MEVTIILKIAFINFWDGGETRDSYLFKFLEHHLGPATIVESETNPDILVSSCMGSIKNVQEKTAKCKIFYTGENLSSKQYSEYNDDQVMVDTFDLIIGYRATDPSKKRIRFPLWLCYYRYVEFNPEDNIIGFIERSYQTNIKKHKPMFGTLLARHDDGGQRATIADSLQKFGSIVYGSKFRNNHPIVPPSVKSKIEFISRCKYHICPENSVGEGYWTEKIFHALQAGTIPLYWAISPPEPDLINYNKYLFCSLESPDKLYNQIKVAVKQPELFIRGSVFKLGASEVIKSYYQNLADAIKSVVKQKGILIYSDLRKDGIKNDTV